MSPVKEVRDASVEAEQELAQFNIEMGMRMDGIITLEVLSSLANISFSLSLSYVICWREC